MIKMVVYYIVGMALWFILFGFILRPPPRSCCFSTDAPLIISFLRKTINRNVKIPRLHFLFSPEAGFGGHF